LIEDVTIYELDGTQEKRLSAVFTGRAIMSIFAEALAMGDLQTIRHSSTQDFNDRIWRNVSRDVWMYLPISDIERVAPQVVSTVYNGATTEITVTQGNKALTYVMHDKDGTLLVDDVMVPAIDRPTSLKKTLELAMPIALFRYAMESDDLRLIQRTSSKDFNHMIWHQVKNIPPTTLVAKPFLSAPLTAMQQDADNNVVLMFGSEYRGAKVKLIRELGFYLVDEVHLINGLDPTQRQELKHNLRLRLAKDVNAKIRAAQQARESKQQFDDSATLGDRRSLLSNEQPQPVRARTPIDDFDPPVDSRRTSATLKQDPFGNAEISDEYVGKDNSIPDDPFTPISIPE